METISLYLDTSVIGGYFDAEFEKPTQELFRFIQLGLYSVYISETTLIEINRAPMSIREKIEELLNTIDYTIIPETVQSSDLAIQYIDDKVLPNKVKEDALHVAAASSYNVNYIISWNFKHLVNITRIRKFNEVNQKMGYNQIDIRTPLEVISDGD